MVGYVGVSSPEIQGSSGVELHVKYLKANFINTVVLSFNAKSTKLLKFANVRPLDMAKFLCR